MNHARKTVVDLLLHKSIYSPRNDMLANSDFYESNGNIPFPETFSYRKSDNIIIGIPVPHAVGDYAKFVVKK